MRVAIISTIMAREASDPLGWIGGWLVTLITGMVISTVWGVATFIVRQDLFHLDFFNAFLHLLFLPFALVTPVGIGAFLFALVLAAPSITVFYIIVRLISRFYRPTLLNRLLSGLWLGTLVVAYLDFPSSIDPAKHHGVQAVHPGVLLGFDTEELTIELSAMTLAIVARPRWFGLR